MEKRNSTRGSTWLNSAASHKSNYMGMEIAFQQALVSIFQTFTLNTAMPFSSTTSHQLSVLIWIPRAVFFRSPSTIIPILFHPTQPATTLITRQMPSPHPPAGTTAYKVGNGIKTDTLVANAEAMKDSG